MEENRLEANLTAVKQSAKPAHASSKTVASGVDSSLAVPTTTANATPAVRASVSVMSGMTSSQGMLERKKTTVLVIVSSWSSDAETIFSVFLLESSPGKGEVESLLRQCKNCRGNQEQFNMIDCDDCKVWILFLYPGFGYLFQNTWRLPQHLS